MLDFKNYKVEARKIEHEYHNDYVQHHTYNALGEDRERVSDIGPIFQPNLSLRRKHKLGPGCPEAYSAKPVLYM